MNRSLSQDKWIRPEIQAILGVASPHALKELDKLCIDLDSSRESLGRDLGMAPEIIRWAFFSGKSARAAQVRRLVLAQLRKLAREHDRLVTA
jgi:hypothetical protein